ncbi:MAG: NfeD family protein, partial [Ignisphaera sp.]
AYKAVQTVRKKRISLEQQLLSSIGIAKTDIREENPGVVYVLNEEWTAYSVKGVIPAGSRVKIVRIDGLKLYVEKID